MHSLENECFYSFTISLFHPVVAKQQEFCHDSAVTVNVPKHMVFQSYNYNLTVVKQDGNYHGTQPCRFSCYKLSLW